MSYLEIVAGEALDTSYMEVVPGEALDTSYLEIVAGEALDTSSLSNNRLVLPVSKHSQFNQRFINVEYYLQTLIIKSIE